MIHWCFFGFQSLHNPFVHINLFVGIGQFLSDTFYLFVIFGRALGCCDFSAFQTLLGDLLGKLLILLLQGIDKLSVDLGQSLYLPIFFHLLRMRTLRRMIICILIITNTSPHL